MQLTLGRRWVLDLHFTVALRKRVDSACCAMRTTVQTRNARRKAALQWERDKAISTMLSGWDSTIGGGDRL